MKLNATTRAVVQKEVPWLFSVIPVKRENWDYGDFWIELDNADFLVQKIGLDTLSLSPDGRWAGKNYLSYLDKIFLVDGDGKVVGEVGREEVQSPSKEWSWRTFRFVPVVKTIIRGFPETVEQAIKRIPASGESVRYVLYLKRWGPEQVILHKLPKSVKSFGEWIDAKSAEAEKALKTTLDV